MASTPVSESPGHTSGRTHRADPGMPVPPASTAPVPGARRGGRQVIPRPPSAEPGGPAPWADVDLGPTSLSLASIGRALETVPSPLPPTFEDELVPGGAPAAVLVPLFEEDGETRVILTRRAAHLRSHRGEVSFPGGRLEAGESAFDGARREASEEIGLDGAGVRYLGSLSRLSTFSSGTVIQPVVGSLRGRPALAPNPSEVEHAFDVALLDLLGTFREEWWRFPGREHPLARADGAYPVWFFELPDDTVWGATARMLVELLRRALAV